MRSAERDWAATDGTGGREDGTGTAEGGQWLHEGLAVACARRFFGRGIPAEELLQEARAAICLAEERFDPGRGCCFSTYAVPVALGALREYCRRAMPVTIPRRMLEELLAGETLSDKHAGDSAAPVRACPVVEDMETVPELLLAVAGFEDRLLLRDAIRRLQQPYAQVIGLRYFCGMSQREVARRMAVEQWQVCRWEKMGLGMLREGFCSL